MDMMTATDPISLFERWFEEAKESEDKYPDAVQLASITEEGVPDVRTVLLKGLSSRGFVIYTNFQGRKGKQLLKTPLAGLCFYWKSLDRQVRVRGPVEVVSEEEADAYFSSRRRGSQIGAWASPQSEEISGRQELMDRVAKYEEKFEGKEVPRPPHWSGFRIIPREIEFWREGDYRLHDRRMFIKNGDQWETRILAP